MKNVDIHQLDLLCQLIDSQSLGEAAARVGMRPPAASQSLARLRSAFPDALYQRQGNAYLLTAQGERSIDGLRAIVRRWREVEHAARRFDPATCEARFAVACVGHAAMPDLTWLHASFRASAPGARLDLQVPLHNAVDIQALRAGKLDVLCASALPAPDARDLHHELLCTHTLTDVLLRRGHPRIGETLSLSQYLAEEHLISHYRNLDPASRSPLDAVLQDMGQPMRRSTYVQSLWTALHMVMRGEQLMTLSRGGARLLVQSLPGLRALPLPAELPPIRTRLHMIWHERTHWSAAHRWLRELLRAAAVDRAEPVTGASGRTAGA